jgi:DNA-binding NarL/FixJ family response regulator
VLIARGRLDEGLALLEAARDNARSQGNVSYEWRIAAEMAHALLASGDRVAARNAANEALALIDQVAAGVDDDELKQNFVERANELLPATLRRRTHTPSHDVLTMREREIASLVAQGLTSRDIADRLVLSARTVESHVANAMAKLGFTTRSQLAAWATENRITG